MGVAPIMGVCDALSNAASQQWDAYLAPPGIWDDDIYGDFDGAAVEGFVGRDGDAVVAVSHLSRVIRPHH